MIGASITNDGTLEDSHGATASDSAAPRLSSTTISSEQLLDIDSNLEHAPPHIPSRLS